MEIKIYDNKLFKGSASRAVKQYIIKILISGGGIVQKNFFHNMFYSETWTQTYVTSSLCQIPVPTN